MRSPMDVRLLLGTTLGDPPGRRGERGLLATSFEERPVLASSPEERIPLSLSGSVERSEHLALAARLTA